MSFCVSCGNECRLVSVNEGPQSAHDVAAHMDSITEPIYSSCCECLSVVVQPLWRRLELYVEEHGRYLRSDLASLLGEASKECGLAWDRKYS